MSLIEDTFGRKFESGKLHLVINGKLPPGMKWPDGAAVRVTAYIMANDQAVQVTTLPDPEKAAVEAPAGAAYWTALDPTAMFGDGATPRLDTELVPTRGSD